MFKRVRVGVERLFADSRIEATPKDGFGPVPRGLTHSEFVQILKEGAPMEHTHAVPVLPADDPKRSR